MTTRAAHPRFDRLLAIAVLLGSSIATAADLDEADVLGRLSHEDWEVRQRASLQLLSDPGLTSRQIDSLFAQASDPEQRHRLLDVARHHMLRRIANEKYARSDKGCLGVTLEPVNKGQIAGVGHPACRVTTTMPGFPGFVWLTSGDIVLAIDDKRADKGEGRQVFRFFLERIAAHEPGDVVKLTVRRDGVTSDVTFKLADFSALTGLYHTEAGAGRVAGRQVVPIRPAEEAGGAVVWIGQEPFQIQDTALTPLRPEHRDAWGRRRRELVGSPAGAKKEPEPSEAVTPEEEVEADDPSKQRDGAEARQ